MTALFFIRQRKTESGDVSYVVVRKDKHADGKWRQRVVARGLGSKREAEKLANDAFKVAQQSRAGVVTTTPTLGAALDDYLESLGEKKGRRPVESVARLHVKPRLGHVELSHLTHIDVQKLVNEKAQAELGPQAVRHMVGCIRAAINHAIRTGTFKGVNVAEAKWLALPRLTRKVHGTLEPAEAMVVLPEIAEHERAMAATAFFTGMRPGEIAYLRPQDVDLPRRTIRVCGSHDVDHPKDGDERIVPITEPLVPYLESALKHAKDGKVFPAHRGGRRLADCKGTEMIAAAMVRAARKGHAGLVTGWTLKCRRCPYSEESAVLEERKKCPACGKMVLWPIGHARRVRFYDLRHTTATLLVDAGVAPAVVANILGHADVNFTLRTYVHLSPAKLVAAVNSVHAPAPALPASTPAAAAPPKEGGDTFGAAVVRARGANR